MIDLLLGIAICFIAPNTDPVADPVSKDPSETFLSRANDFYHQQAYPHAIRNFLFALELSPSLNESFEFNFKIGYALKNQGRVEEALTHFRQASADGRFGDYALYQIAGMKVRQDSIASAAEVYESLLRSFPFSVFLLEARVELAGLYLRTNRPDRAEALLTDALNSLTDKTSLKVLFQPRIELLRGDQYEKQEMHQLAVNTWRSLLKEFPHADEALEARNRIHSLKSRLRSPFSGSQFLDGNNVLILQGKYHEALNELASARNRYSSSDMQRQIETSIAKIYVSQGLYDAAIPRYRNLWKKYQHKEALFHLARAARFAGQLDLSNRSYEEYLQFGSLSTNWRNYVLFEMANNLSAKGDASSLREANKWYRQVRQNAPLVTLYGYTSAFREGFNSYKLGEYEDALQRFSELGKKLPALRSRCEFWTAKTLERLNRTTEARRLYTSLAEKRYSDYYGMLAYFLSREDTLMAKNYFYTGYSDSSQAIPHFRQRTPMTTTSAAAVSEFDSDDTVAFRARIAKDLLGPRIAERELRARQDVVFRSYDETVRLKEVAEALGCYDVAVDASSILASVYQKKFTGLFEQYALTYPQYYSHLIDHFSRQAGMDAPLVYSVIRRESAFRSHVISSARAVGLMQVMPFTGNELAVELHMPTFDMITLQNPEESIRLGTYYLWKQSCRFEGYIPAILAAYNAGPHRAAFWMNQYNAADPMEFPEIVDVLETNNYIKRILLDRWVYSQLYPS